MAGKRQPRGPKCPVCKAVMHVPEGGGKPVCSFRDSHAAIIKMRLKAGQKSNEDRKKS